MKSNVIPRTGIVDAMATGLNEAARRPWLWLVPLLVDVALWLAPKLSVAALTERLMSTWKAMLPLLYTADQMAAVQEGIDLVQTGMIELGKSINLGAMLTAGWLAPPSALASMQATRYLLVSDAVLAPLSLGLPVKPLEPSSWQGNALQVSSVLGVIAVIIVLWVISHLLTALYFRLIAHSLPAARSTVAYGALPASRQPVTEDQRSLFDGWLPLAGHFAVLSLFASVVTFLLRLPLALVTALTLFSSSVVVQFLFMLTGGITLWLTMWFLSALYFAGDALAFERQPLAASLAQSLILARTNGLKVLGLAVVVNLLMLGARAVWGFVGSNPAGAALAIIANSYLSTAMVIGIYVYYRDIRRQWQAAQVSRQVNK